MQINIPFGKQIDPFFEVRQFEHGVQSCDILLTRGYNFLGETIRSLSNGCVNHAALVIKDGNMIEATPFGIKINPFSNFVKDKEGVLVFRNINLTEDQKKVILQYAYMKADAKEGYDYTGILRYVFAGFKNNPNEEYCSEFLTNAFAKSGSRISNYPATETTPQGMLDFQYIDGAYVCQNGWTLQDSKNIKLDKVTEFLQKRNDLKNL